MKSACWFARYSAIHRFRIKFFCFFCFSVITSVIYTQDTNDSEKNDLKFSGTININTNGISPIPAFSLDDPSMIGVFSLKRKRLSFDPEIAFSMDGRPWFVSPAFSYKVIDGKRFNFDVRTIYSLNYSYPEVLQDGMLRPIKKVEPYLLLRFNPSYRISETIAIGLTTFHGHGFKKESIQWGNFFIFNASFTQLKLGKSMYYSFFPQLLYVNLDGTTDGVFASAIFGVGFKKLPLFISTQLTQAVRTNFTPDPGFKWNVGLSYSF